MKTRNNPTQPHIDEGYSQYKGIKFVEKKSISKNIKQDQIIKEAQKMSKQSTHQDRSKRTSNMVNEEKKTPQKETTQNIKAPKMIPATKSTVKKTTSSKKIQQPKSEKQAQVKGMNDVATNLFGGKSKKIKKQSKKNNKTQDYQNFYKFHFSKLKQEHTNWAADKITQLISLLWRKRKMDVKYESEKEVEQIYQKIMNGKQVFKELKIKGGANQEEIDGLWNRLPIQSKRKWELESSGIVLQKTNKKKGKMNLNKSQQPEQHQNQFSFLKKVM